MRFVTTTLRFGRKRVVVTRPNPHHYGHLGLEMVMSLARAREVKAAVYFVRPSTSLGLGLFELDSPEVRVLRPTRLVGELLRTGISWRMFRNRFERWRDETREEVEREFVRETSRYVGNSTVPAEVQEGLRVARRRFRRAAEQAARKRRHRPAYYERRRLRTPVPVRLHALAEEDAARQAI